MYLKQLIRFICYLYIDIFNGPVKVETLSSENGYLGPETRMTFYRVHFPCKRVHMPDCRLGSCVGWRACLLASGVACDTPGQGLLYTMYTIRYYWKFWLRYKVGWTRAVMYLE